MKSQQNIGPDPSLTSIFKKSPKNQQNNLRDKKWKQDLEARQHELEAASLENLKKENDIELKKGICNWVKIVVSIYLIFVATFIIIVACQKFIFSDAALITLLTTTTINILALPYMIIKSLFPK